MNIKCQIVFAALPFILTCCNRQAVDIKEEIIPFNRMKISDYTDIQSIFFNDAEYVILDTETQEAMFRGADKILFKNGKLYLLDQASRKIIVFDRNGSLDMSLSKRGRGPGEYLQITDFDVDDEGNIWLVDGQRNLLLTYSSNGKFLRSKNLQYEVEFIKCLSSDSLLLSLAPWDASRYKRSTILLVNRELDVADAMIERDSATDPNYVFPTIGFTDTGECVLYHRPINDKVFGITSVRRKILRQCFNY